MKFFLSFILGLVLLVIGTHFGFVGAANYFNVLWISIGCEAGAIICFSYFMACTSGYKLLFPFLCIMAAGLVIIQAGCRLLGYTDHDHVMQLVNMVIGH